MSGYRPGVGVALVGTTASGKSALAAAVARRHADVDLVSMDSMAVYRGMDIGTAKPSAAVRSELRHHLVDLVDPAEDFTVSRFQRAARQALAQIRADGHRALLVGGTGLYLRSVVDDLHLPGRWPAVAAQLEFEADEPDGVATLYGRLMRLDPRAASRIEPTNRRRVVRALEVTIGSGRPFSTFGPGLDAYPPTPFTLIGLRFDPEVVDRRIAERFEIWVRDGLVDEARALAARPGGISRTARQALGYRELLAHVEEGRPLEQCVQEAVRATRRFARRQWAWFRRDPRIRWVAEGEDPLEVLDAALGEPAPHSTALGARP